MGPVRHKRVRYLQESSVTKRFAEMAKGLVKDSPTKMSNAGHSESVMRSERLLKTMRGDRRFKRKPRKVIDSRRVMPSG